MLQASGVAAGSQSLFLLSISKDAESKESFAVLTVPLGVYLAPGIQIKVDKRRAFKVLFEICDAKGCYAGFKMSGTVLKAFKVGLNAKTYVWTSKERAIEFPISLRGFSKAWAYFQEQL